MFELALLGLVGLVALIVGLVVAWIKIGRAHV